MIPAVFRCSPVSRIFHDASVFYAVCCDGHLSLKFGYSLFYRHHSGFIVPLPLGIFYELDVVGQYVVVRKASFDPALSILGLRCSTKVDCYSYVSTEHPFSGYDFPFGNVLSLLPS